MEHFFCNASLSFFFANSLFRLLKTRDSRSTECAFLCVCIRVKKANRTERKNV